MNRYFTYVKNDFHTHASDAGSPLQSSDARESISPSLNVTPIQPSLKSLSRSETRVDKILWQPRNVEPTPCLQNFSALFFRVELSLLQDMAIPDEVIGIVHIFGPKWPEMFKSYLQPWLRLAIVVNYSSFFGILHIRLTLVAQTKHVPRGVDWVDITLECNQGRRKCSKPPHCQV